MKKIVVIALAFFFYHKGMSQVIEYSYVIIKYVNFNLTSIVDIDCDGFETSFDTTSYKECIVDNPLTIRKLITLSKKPMRNDNGTDVRLKLLFFKKGSISPALTLCMNKFGKFIWDNKYFYDKKLYNLITTIIKSDKFCTNSFK